MPMPLSLRDHFSALFRRNLNQGMLSSMYFAALAIRFSYTPLRRMRSALQQEDQAIGRLCLTGWISPCMVSNAMNQLVRSFPAAVDDAQSVTGQQI
jgi:hypothetical protein